MFRVVPFELEHIKVLLEDPMNGHLKHWKDADYGHPRKLANYSWSVTVMFSDVPLMCCFFVPLWHRRAYLVCALNSRIAEFTVGFHRNLNRALQEAPFDRVEFDVPFGMEKGSRRARLVGFEVMCERARRYLPDGTDATVYEWVREY